MFRQRSKSHSSSSSSSSSSSCASNSSKKKFGRWGLSGSNTNLNQAGNTNHVNYAYGGGVASPTRPSFPNSQMPPPFPKGPMQSQYGNQYQPPPYAPPQQHQPQQQKPPASGFRIALTTSQPFPPVQQTGRPITFDADNTSPVFFGSAIFANSVHPCKVCPNLNIPCHVSYGGREIEHQGRYDLLPFDDRTMELVPANGGYLPVGKRMVEGGYEEDGKQLYHAIGYVGSTRVPGKVGAHLGGANIAFGGQEYVVSHNYEVLCWRH